MRQIEVKRRLVRCLTGAENTMIRVISLKRIAVLLASIILISQCLHFNLFAQQWQLTPTSGQSSREHLKQIIESLEADNTLRRALERGDRGNGIHYEWMDKMRAQSIKQASFRIRFQWRKQSNRLKIIDTKYLSNYYRFDTFIENQERIEEIRSSGLEQELRDEILRRAVINLTQRTDAAKSNQLCGTLYLNLLDEEILPILDEPPDVDSECKTKCGDEV